MARAQYHSFINMIYMTQGLFCVQYTQSSTNNLKTSISSNTFKSKQFEGCALFDQTQTLDINPENMLGK